MVQGQAAEKLVYGFELKEIIPIIAAGFKVTIAELNRFGCTGGAGSENDGGNIF